MWKLTSDDRTRYGKKSPERSIWLQPPGSLVRCALLLSLLALPVTTPAFEYVTSSTEFYEVDPLEYVVIVDTDGDGIPDDQDPCPSDPQNDWDGDGVCSVDDICPNGDDNLDLDADGWPDACDICPEDPMDLCAELPSEECADPAEVGPGPGECPEACSGAYESAGFPRVYGEDPADCPDCAESFADFCDGNGDGQIDADKAGVGVTLCYGAMPCNTEGGGTPAACPCPCSGGPAGEIALPECEDDLAFAAPTCGGDDGRPCNFEDKPRLCQRYTRTNNDFDENACNMLSDDASRQMAFRTATLDVDVALDASNCGCKHQQIEEPAPQPRWIWPGRRCKPIFPEIFPRIFPRLCRPRTCTRDTYECDGSKNLELKVKISVSDSPWGTELLDHVRLFECTPNEDAADSDACDGATIDASGEVEGDKALGSCEDGVCSVTIDDIACGEGTHSRRLCLLHESTPLPPDDGFYPTPPVDGDETPEPVGFGTPTFATLDVNFSIEDAGCELEVTSFNAEFHEYAPKKRLDPEKDANPCLTLFADEVPGMTVCERQKEGPPKLRPTLDHLIRIQESRQDGADACFFPDRPQKGFPPRSPKGFWTPPPLSDAQKACADWMWEKRFKESERCQSDPGCAERFCWCGYNKNTPDGKCDVAAGQEAMQREFLEDFCGRCHQHGKDSKGDFKIDDAGYPSDKNNDPWDRIFERLDDGEMPPPDAFVPPDDLEAFMDSLDGPGFQCSNLGEVCDASSLCCNSLHSCLDGVCAPGCMKKDDLMCSDADDE